MTTATTTTTADIVAMSDEQVIEGLRDIEFNRVKGDERRQLVAQLIAVFWAQPETVKIEVVRVLQLNSLTQSFLMYVLDSKHKIDILPKFMLTPIFLKHFQAANYEQLSPIVDRLVEVSVCRGVSVVNAIPALVLSDVVKTFKTHPDSFKSKEVTGKILKYWFERLLDSRLFTIQINNRILADIVSAMITLKILSLNVLQECWQSANRETQVLIADVVATANMDEIRTENQLLIPLIQRILHFRQELLRQNADVNHGFFQNHAHNVHMLDVYRSYFLASINELVSALDIRLYTDKVDSRFNYYTMLDATSQSVHEILTNTTLFSCRNSSQTVTMTEVLKKIILLFVSIVPYINEETATEQEKEEFHKLYAERAERQKLAFKRLEDELIDMTGTCQSGHINRLFNATVGVITIDQRLNFSEEIKHSFQTCISKFDENMQDQLLEEMTTQQYSAAVETMIEDIVKTTYVKLMANYFSSKISVDILLQQVITEAYAYFNTVQFAISLIKKQVWPRSTWNLHSELSKHDPDFSPEVLHQVHDVATDDDTDDEDKDDTDDDDTDDDDDEEHNRNLM